LSFIGQTNSWKRNDSKYQGFYLRHKPTGHFCSSGNWNITRYFSADSIPYIFNGVGPAKVSVTNWVKSGWFESPEETAAFQLWRQQYGFLQHGTPAFKARPQCPAPANDRLDRLQFAMDLEIIEVELIPGNSVYSFAANLNKPKRMANK